MLWVIIVAGGVGRRFNSAVPKQYLSLQGKPVIVHTIDRFQKAFVGEHLHLSVVINPAHEHLWKKIAQEYALTDVTVVYGGKERYYSVKNALIKLSGQGIVAVHDAVRPFITPDLLRRLYEHALQYGSAVPYVLPHSSVRYEMPDGSNRALERHLVRMIQTPQFFDLAKLKKAYVQTDFKNMFTDDASVYETLAEPVHLVEGLAENIKITTELDWIIAQELIKKF